MMGVFSEKDDEIPALLFSDSFLLFGFFAAVTASSWVILVLALFVAAVGVFVLVLAFREYRWEGLKEFF